VKTRQTTIQANGSHAAATTDIIPIRVSDPISRIVIPYGVTVGAAARLGHLSQVFTKIEIVDGSDVLFSLTGSAIDGMARQRAIASSSTFSRPDISTEDFGNLIIDFGRYLYDKELAFDPTKFSNPQIKVTHNFATVEANATAVEYAILADVMEGLSANPRGFLMKKEVKSWVAVAAGWEYTEMPRDYPYRAIWLKGHTKSVGVGSHWSRAVLSEDNYKRVPFDCLVDDQIADNAADYGLITEHVSGTISAVATPLFAAPCYAGMVLAMCTMATNALEGHNLDGGRYEVKSANGTDDFRGIVEGLCPQGLVTFNMGPKDNIEDWYDPKSVGSLRLEVLGAGAYTIRLLTEQLRNY
jgi:hypothetical protein